MNPFTVIVCTACTPEGRSPTLEALKATVRRCPHGMLVTTDCLVAHQGCAGPGPDAVTVVVQPCGVDRRPDGPVRRVGPVGPQGIRAVCRWLEAGDWNAPLSTWWDARSHVGSHN